MPTFAPYLFLYGRCAEALEFYKGVFGGSYEAMRTGDAPASAQMPPGAENRIMHASFTSDVVTFMASDGREDKAVDPDAGNIAIALTLEDGARGEQIFNALAAGGRIDVPLGEAFWGGRFGDVIDKFGTEWMLNLQ
jgi:PhnB protein